MQRIHHLDNLRALAMLAGVVFHAALAYSPLLHPYWPTADAVNSGVVDVVAWFLHLFRMPLFFVVTGFFAAQVANDRGMAGLFRNRLARVLLPLLVCLPLLLISMHGLTSLAVAHVRNPSPVLAWLADYADEHGALPRATGLAHLWFLFYVMVFTLLVWVVTTLAPTGVGAWLAARRPALLPAWMPLLLVPPLASVTVPWPAPESWLPSLWALVFFGLYFALGYQLFHRPGWLDALRSLKPMLLVGALATYAGLLWSQGSPVAGPSTPLRHVLHAGLEAYAGFWMTLCCLLAGKAWLAGKRPVLRWLADASYWVYLVHLPVLLAIQYPLLDVPLHWTAKFAIATLATLAVSLISYQLMVRHTIIGSVLNGTARKVGRLDVSTRPA